MATVKELEKNKVQIEFEIAPEAFSEARQKAYQKNKGKFTVPGFRKGHAPKSVIEKFYGEGIFFEDAFDIAFPDAYEKAVEELNLLPVSRPENVDIASFEPLTIKADLYVKPEVTLGTYKGVEATFTERVVTEEDVQKELERLREQNARFVDVERAAAMGDKVVLDYSGSVDGEKFEGGTAEAQQLDLGSGMFIPGFEEQIVGMKAGDEKNIEVTFPEEYHAENLAGKPAVFEIKLGAVKEKQLPELDDDFAQDVSEFDTLEEYKADLRAKQEERCAQENKYAKEDAVVKAIVDAAQVDIPQCMVDTQIDRQMQELQYSLLYQGLNLEQYYQYTGTTPEAMREQYAPIALDRVKSQLVLQAVMEAEKCEPTDEEIDALIEQSAKNAGKELEEYKQGMKADQVEYIKERAAYDKLISMLVDAAKITPAKEETEKE